MININISNMIGASTSTQSDTVSSDSLSTFKDFISEFKLEDENNGPISNNIEDVDESLILYNFIYTLYQKLNIEGNLTNLEEIKSLLNSKFNLSEMQDINSMINNTINTSDSMENNFVLELSKKLSSNEDIKELINNINNLINENEDNSNEIDKSLNLLIDTIKNQIQDLSKSSDGYSKYENLDTLGVLNISKIDEYNSLKSDSKDMDCLENIISSDENSYINSFTNINKFNTLYNNNVSKEINQPVREIRQEFITEDIIKSVKYMKSSELEELNVKLNPRNLGEMTIKLSKNNEHSNLLITVEDKNLLDMVNKNMEDIKKHLNDANIKMKDIVVTVKNENENLFSDNLNREFNQERRFNQNERNKYKRSNQQVIEELHNSEYNRNDDNLNILI